MEARVDQLQDLVDRGWRLIAALFKTLALAKAQTGMNDPSKIQIVNLDRRPAAAS
jgi:hypothetical protein